MSCFFAPKFVFRNVLCIFAKFCPPKKYHLHFCVFFLSRCLSFCYYDPTFWLLKFLPILSCALALKKLTGTVSKLGHTIIRCSVALPLCCVCQKSGQNFSLLILKYQHLYIHRTARALRVIFESPSSKKSCSLFFAIAF